MPTDMAPRRLHTASCRRTTAPHSAPESSRHSDRWDSFELDVVFMLMCTIVCGIVLPGLGFKGSCVDLEEYNRVPCMLFCLAI